MIEMNAQVSFGPSSNIYPKIHSLNSLRNSQQLRQINQWLGDISETMVNSFIVEWSCLSNVFLLEMI